MKKENYITRMYLREVKGWTNKMITVLLQNVPYKRLGNIYGGGIIKLYRAKDIEQIEKTKQYQDLKKKVDKIREKVKEEFEEHQRQKLIDLAKLYEQNNHFSIIPNSKKFKKVEWQKNCLKNIKDKNNVILSSPTSSGKTVIFLEWALMKKERPIFITSPTKALSNQRYVELKKLKYTVGIETGEMKKVSSNCDIICCTQEIYTKKYINKRNSTLIIDEFHYIFENQDRARTYIDALNKSKSNNIFICSATFGNTNEVKKYIDKVSKRNFYLYKNTERLSTIVYKDSINPDRIQNSFVIAFSKDKCNDVANYLLNKRIKIIHVSEKCKDRYNNNLKEIKMLANKYKIQFDQLYNQKYLELGIAVYYSVLLPKEKFFIERIFEKRLIDTIIGTDALALGVNFPVENVIFTQLSKDYVNCISKNLFEQLSGRAGRKGYYETGYIYYCDYFDDSYFFNIQELYETLLSEENEDISIRLTPIISNILKGYFTVEEEINYIIENSTDYDKQELLDNITEKLEFINNYKIKSEKQDEFNQNIKNVYFDEFDVYDNCYIFECILLNKSVKEMIGLNLNNFNYLLQLRKYFKSLPKPYRKKSYILEIEKIINDIDDTALNITFLENLV